MKHCIIVKFKKNAMSENRDNFYSEIKSLFMKCTELEGINGVELLENCIDRDNRYDIMICIDMSKNALPAYDQCIWHKKWKEEYSNLIEKKAIFDYE